MKLLKQSVIVLSLSLVSIGSAQAFDLNSGISALGGAIKAVTLSDAQVTSYARQWSAQSDGENKVAPTGNKYAKRLASITKGLTNYDGLKLNYKVYLSPEVNAFAMADGTVRVYSGLMDLMTDDELLSVMGHEIGHVKNGHTAGQMRKALLTGAARDAISTAGGTAATLSKSQLGDLGETVLNATFSRSDETQSDEYGLNLLRALKRNPMASVTALEKLAKLDSGSSSSLLSSHPASSKRAKHISDLISKNK
jgi:putative metalloprotease